MEYFVNVILPIPLENFFTYTVSREEADFLQPGMRVAVPFGKSKIYTALVYEIHTSPPVAYKAKDLYQILDDKPLVNTLQLAHWKWLANYYMCTLGEVFRSALPGLLLLESETHILANKAAELEEDQLPDDEFLVLEALKFQTSLRVRDVISIVEKKTVLPLLNRLLKKNAIVLKEDLQHQYKPKLMRCIKISSKYTSEIALEQLLDQLQRAPKQGRALLALFQLQATAKKPITIGDLETEANVSRAVINSLIKREALEEYFVRTDRVSYDNAGGDMPLNPLNNDQLKALDDISKSFENKNVTLLHGVTSSGKTEVYMQLLKDSLDAGKQVLYLLPEIALTTQLIGRLQQYFGSKLSVYHSKYSMQERVEVWNNLNDRKDKAQLIIGARSALFLPFAALGLIIVDEEHETSFKQFDPAPRYHARDAAIVLAKLHNCKVLLGSATPSIESFNNTRTAKYGYASIDRRFGNVLMPEIELVDLKEQYRKKRMKGHFSERLLKEIAETLDAREQIILFQNRRGYAPIVECTSCGHSPQCPNCDVSLTYHQFRNQLRCHYCGHQTPLEQACQACGNSTLDTKGFGTEQVAEEVMALYPNARVGRMDLDTTRGKYSYEKIISAFEQQELDILVGTQMITKGLDFRHVNLVGIMNADTLLNFPDFRAHERSFQLLTQVAGRAGRTKKRGKVLIQTYNPYHQILKQVSTADYLGMFEEQLYEREQYKYPPANRLIRITMKDKDYNKLNEASAWFASALRNVFNEGILGPEFPAIPRIRNQYLKHILVKTPREASFAKTKNSIKRIGNSFNAISQYKSVRLIYNVDHL